LEFQEGTLRLTPVIDDIRAAFGLLKANKSVSLEEMESAIEQAVVEYYGVRPVPLGVLCQIGHEFVASWLVIPKVSQQFKFYLCG